MHPTQLEQYQRDGFLILSDLLSPEFVREVCAETSRMIAACPYGQDQKGVCWDRQIKEGVVKLSEADRELGVFKLHHSYKHDAYFRALLDRMPELDLVEELLGPDLKAYAQQLVMKPPHHGQWQPYHQDGWYFNYAPSEGVAVWIALDDATVENGCLWVIPGSHHGPLVNHHVPKDVNHLNAGFLEAEGTKRDEGLAVPLPAGSAVLFHNRLFHMSGPNKTAFRRRALVTHYASAQWKPRDPSKPCESVALRGRSYAGCI